MRELGGASEQQAEVIDSLKLLLKLLQSEDRRSSVERERERLNGLLKDVRGIISQEKSVRAATQNSEAPSSAAPGQLKAIDESEKLLDAMRKHDAKDSDAKPSDDGKPADDAKPSNEQPADPSQSGEPKAGEQQSGEPKSGEQPQDAPSGQPSKSSDGSEGQGKAKPKQTPGREQIEQALEQMQKALDALRGQERDTALKSEDRAMQELHDAATKLEEQLKLLREEEKEMMLASLEARFQQMLAAETQIHEATVTLAATPQKDWLDQYYSRCRELAQEQSSLATECEQTVVLLREDGTSV